MSLQEKRIGFIGTGAMGSALIKGILQKGIVKPAQIFASDVDQERLHQLTSELGINSVADNYELLRQADIVVLALKPQNILGVLQSLKGKWSSKQLAISIAAGVTLREIEPYLETTPVIRVMPNTPCLVGAGATGISLGNNAQNEHGNLAMELFRSVGEAFILAEELLAAVTGLSGSGPAYCYLFIEALADGGVREGLPRPIAQRLAAQTLLGAAKMVLETGKHPGELKDMVTSPAGTTIAAVALLEKRSFRSAAMDAVWVSASQSRELSAEKE